MAKKVYLGVGHGGKDPGAVANGFNEKDLNLDIAKACRDELKKYGVEVMMSRESDISENLSARIKECNAYNPDFAIDIHNNAGRGDGGEVFHSKSNANDDAFAINILNEIYAIGQNMHSTTPTVIKSGLKTRLLNDGRDYFGFIRQIKCPSVLVECAFVDNRNDMNILDTAEERKTMGVAIAKGILKTFGIEEKKEVVTPKPTTTTPTTSGIKKGDLVSIKSGAKYSNGKKVPSWVVKQKWYVESVSGNRAVINKNEKGTNAINSVINVMYLVVAKKSTTVKPTKATIKVGSTVKVKQGAKTYAGGKLANFVYKRKHKVKEIKGDRAVITYLGITVAAVRLSDLTLA